MLIFNSFHVPDLFPLAKASLKTVLLNCSKLCPANRMRSRSFWFLIDVLYWILKTFHDKEQKKIKIKKHKMEQRSIEDTMVLIAKNKQLRKDRKSMHKEMKAICRNIILLWPHMYEWYWICFFGFWSPLQQPNVLSAQYLNLGSFCQCSHCLPGSTPGSWMNQFAEL